MKTKLAKQTYLILISGLLFMGFLLCLIGFQLKELSGNSIYGRMAQMNILRILNDTNQSVDELKRRLEMIPGIRVRPDKNVQQRQEKRQLPVFMLGELKPPFDWTRPFIIDYQNKKILVNFTAFNMVSVMVGIYIFVMAILVIAMLLLCYWAMRRLEKINLLARAALAQLAENINTQIVLPIDHREAALLHNDIQRIQNIMQESLQKRTQMLAAISHDLKTPITRLKLRVELLHEHEKKEALLTDIEKLESMLASILAFSKNFLQEENTVQFNLSDLVSSLCEDAVDIGESIDAEIEENILYQGRLMGIKRAIGNVLDNALKYGKVDVVVKLFEDKQKKRILCEISDQGKGVDASLYQRLFEPFYRVDQSRGDQVSGSGLGLSITKEIIEGHGGKIRLMPRKPHGLLVQIVLPCS
ncbi:sensor histidine kinase [Fangia hongkongensis]|uniref:sensor histidine kinase n=1 Tax=Fangia hongkongensis TaxID=270495 RepID=UPI0003828954|nr:HAMP domain-containing sensor histidine kinase [Fangia hongkongensis]MBK2124306.1 HAMP domain-containing histidine kinase [Fangia hongkongensis]